MYSAAQLDFAVKVPNMQIFLWILNKYSVLEIRVNVLCLYCQTV